MVYRRRRIIKMHESICQIYAAAPNFAASETSQTLLLIHIFSLLTHVGSRVQSENSPTQNQTSQSSHSPITDLHRSTDVTLRQTRESTLQLENEYSSDAANENFHSVGEEPSPRHQQQVFIYSS